MVTGLSCFLCGKQCTANTLQGLCECGRPLRVDHDLDPSTLRFSDLAGRVPSLWRYREVLPDCEPVSLGEGMTPLHEAQSLGANLLVKDEGVNPTASFKAR